MGCWVVWQFLGNKLLNLVVVWLKYTFFQMVEVLTDHLTGQQYLYWKTSVYCSHVFDSKKTGTSVEMSQFLKLLPSVWQVKIIFNDIILDLVCWNKETEGRNQKHKICLIFCHDVDLFLLVLYCSVDDIDRCKTFMITAGKVL